MNTDRLPNPASKTFLKLVQPEFAGNESGQEPIGTKVLVMTDWVDNETKSGLLKLPADVIERMSLAVTTGRIVAVGGGAFTDWPNSERPWPGRVPTAGDRVHLAKYAGLLIEGRDGKHYRLVQDTDICSFEIKDEE